MLEIGIFYGLAIFALGVCVGYAIPDRGLMKRISRG